MTLSKSVCACTTKNFVFGFFSNRSIRTINKSNNIVSMKQINRTSFSSILEDRSLPTEHLWTASCFSSLSSAVFFSAVYLLSFCWYSCTYKSAYRHGYLISNIHRTRNFIHYHKWISIDQLKLWRCFIEILVRCRKKCYCRCD